MKTVLRSEDCAEFLRRLRSLAPQTARRWGRMSVGQMVCHLSDTYRVSLGERAATPVGNPVSHTLIKYLMLYTPLPIPRGTPSARELDQEQGGTPPQAFTDDVRTLEGLLERFAAGTGPVEYEHPFFGRLSRAQWRRFHAKHTDHHLRQFGA